MQSSISGLKPNTSPLQVTLKSLEIDMLSRGKLAFEVRGWLNGWEGRGRSPILDCRVWSSAALRGFARIVELKLTNSGHDNGNNIILHERLLESI